MRLVIVAEVRLYREGLARLLGRDRSLEVAGVAGDAREGVACCAELHPDLVLVGAGGTIGPWVVAGVHRVAPRTDVITIAAAEQEDEILAWAEAGVAAYVTRDQSLDELRETIRHVARGQTLCSPLVGRALLHRVATFAHSPLGGRAPAATLTSREAQVLELIEQGLSNKEIAARLTIELATVKNHVHNILGKLGVKRRRDAVSRFSPVALVPGAAPRSYGPIVGSDRAYRLGSPSTADV